MKSINKALYVTRPILPSFDSFCEQAKEIWDSGVLTNNGPKVQELERALTQYLKVSNTSVFCNGTIGLLCAIKALDLSGEVITTPFTFPATPHVLSWQGIKPVFCDIEEDTFNLDPQKIEALISSETTAILGVHVFGNPCHIVEIDEIAKKYGLKVIYDAAHAFGVEVSGRGIGSFGDITMFSFHATKLFHTLEGGGLTFDNALLEEKIYSIRNFGIENEDLVSMVGINGKVNELQAIMGLLNLPDIDAKIIERKHLFDKYQDNLDGINGISLHMPVEGIRPNYQYCVIRVDHELFGMSRDDLYEEMKQYNIFTRKYFYPPCYQYTHYREEKAKFPVTEKVSSEVLCLPIYNGLDSVLVKNVCDIIKELSMARV